MSSHFDINDYNLTRMEDEEALVFYGAGCPNSSTPPHKQPKPE